MSATVAGSACTNRILRLTVSAAEQAGDDHADQEEHLHLEAGVAEIDAPDEPGGEEAVVEALVRGERLRCGWRIPASG